MPVARLVRARLIAYNDAIRDIGARTGAIVVDLDAEPASVDPRLWSVDRLHASARGHERIAAAACEALGLPGADRAWAEPLPAIVRRRRHAVARRRAGVGTALPHAVADPPRARPLVGRRPVREGPGAGSAEAPRRPVGELELPIKGGEIGRRATPRVSTSSA